MKGKIFAVALIMALVLMAGCATRQHAKLTGSDGQEIYASGHLGIFPGPDDAIRSATAYAIIQKTDAEIKLLSGYSSGTSSAQESEALGFIINDRYAKWNLTIKTRIGGLTIFQTDVPPRTKLVHSLKWGEYVTVWSDSYNKYTDTLKVVPYADVRTMIKRGNKEEEVKGHWMTQLPQ